MERWDSADNVLCVRLDNAGDVLMTSPAIRALKASHPGRRITLLGSASGCAVGCHIPEIDALIRYDAPWSKNDATGDAAIDLRLRDTLAAREFDAAVIFTVYSQSPLPAALMCHLAGIPLRLAHCRENPYRLLTDWVREPEPQGHVRHEVQRQLDLVASVGAHCADTRMSFHVGSSARQGAARKLAAAGVDLEGAWLVMHPGASAPSRRYPEERFARIAHELVNLTGCQIVLTGDGSEVALCEHVRHAAGANVISLAGGLALHELGATIAMAQLLISNNTGPVHVAAAVGTPVVDLYALTNPQHTPWQVPHRLLFHDVPCKYCYRSICPQGHHACLRGVPVETVIEAVLDLWDERRRTRVGPKPAGKGLPARADILAGSPSA